MAIYGISTFGRSYVVDEQLPELPYTRKVFLVVTFLLGIFCLLKFLHHLKTISSRKDKTCNYLPLSTSAKRIVLCFILSYVIHTIHFVDNIYRPVAYFEPKWLYDKVVLSEMEITFFANFPISLSGLIYMQRFTMAVSKRNLGQTMDACKKMGWYLFGSFLTLGHYRTEPPWKYSLSTSFTIAGEGLASVVLAVWLFRYYRQCRARLLSGDSVERGAHVDKTSKVM